MAAHTINPTQERHRQANEFEANLVYITRLCLMEMEVDLIQHV